MPRKKMKPQVPELELEVIPELAFVKPVDGKPPRTLVIPEPIYEKEKLVGWQKTPVDLVSFLRSVPMYDPFASAKGYYFDTKEWERVWRFMTEYCCFPEGYLTGLPFVPERWQSAIYANLLCWKSEETDLRRYRECFIFVPRKNSKTSSFGAVISLYVFFCDKEKRGQLYCAAADTEQAALNFRHAIYMIENNKVLLGKLRDSKVFRSTKSFEHKDGSIFKVLSSIADTKHGLSPNFVYIDEVHAHPDSELIDVLLTGTGSRQEPLTLYTTTADYDRPSPCNTLYEKAKAIAQGRQFDPTFLPVIYEADRDDDFRKEAVWRKANPNFGKSVTRTYFEQQVRSVENNPVELNRFLRLHLNIRTKTETAWIPAHVWANGNPNPEEVRLLSIVAIKDWITEHSLWHNVGNDSRFTTATSIDVYLARYQVYWSWYINKVEELRDEECYAGFDNSQVHDLASLSLFFPVQGVILNWSWCPAKSIYQRSHEQSLPYGLWYDAGLINSTSPLEAIDEDAIIAAMLGDSNHTGILNHFRGCREIVFDRYCVHAIYLGLKKYGFPCRAYPQNFAGMNEPCRKLSALVQDKMLFHGGHPVLDWMVGNVVIQQSRDGLMRPDKSKSINKIDGIVAGLMGIGSYLYPEDEVITEIRSLR